MGLHIITCIKSVIVHYPDKKITRLRELSQLNPFDRVALEMALNLKELYGGIITAVSMGPKTSDFVLYEALSMGADKAILICDKDLAESDTLATSTVLSAAINKIKPFDIVLFGTRTLDGDTGQVGPQTATALDIPMVASTKSITKIQDGFRIEGIADGFKDVYETPLPFSATIHPNAVLPRDIGLYGIEKAFYEGKIETFNLDDLNIKKELVGKTGSPTKVISMKKISKNRKCEFINGTIEEQCLQLIERLVNAGLIG